MTQLTHAQFLALRRFPALDGLRAIAAVMVVFSHYGGHKWAPYAGWLGVHLFFVISGFLITTLALREEDRNGRVSVRNFWIRRIFRLMPVYYVVLGATVLLYFLRGEFHTARVDEVLPYYLTFNNEYIAAGHIFGHSWTLAIEQKFYIVWPVIAFALGAMPFGRRLSVAFGAIGLLVAAMVVPFYSWGTPSYIVILMGCVLAIMMHYRRGFAVMKYLTHPAAGFLFMAGLVVMHFTAMEWLAAFGSDTALILVYGVCVFLLLPGIFNGGWLAKFLSLAPMRFIGERSYGLYLVQQLAAIVLMAVMPMFKVERTLSAIAVTIVSLMIADMLYRWVEQPMIEVGRKLINRISKPKKRAPEPVREEPARDETPQLVPNTV
ncbi:acyltransferase [Lentzea alba]|uniref:acyltransferase family protein n=1 Tax=Lentzea alba TaxID=2714351 RepID=UPI0039BF681D